MASAKITDLDPLSIPDIADLVVVVDVSDTTMAASGTNKKTTVGGILGVVDPDNVEIPATTSTVGQLRQAGSRLLHTYGTESVFLGRDAGNFTQSVGYNIGVGAECLGALTSGVNNVAVGYRAGKAITTGGQNFALGTHSLEAATTGDQNVAMGTYALATTSTGADNIAVGYYAMNEGSAPGQNVAIGSYALKSASSSSNVAVGWTACEGTTGGGNVAIGHRAGRGNTTGSDNTFVGRSAGDSGTSSGLTKSSAFGYNAQVTASSTMVLGGTGSDAASVYTALGLYFADASSTTVRTKASVVASWGVSTDASRLGDLILSTDSYNGAHEAIRFKDTGSIVAVVIPIANVRSAADDTAAAALSPAVPVGGLYRTGSALKIRVS